jgi:hypothetical protein
MINHSIVASYITKNFVVGRFGLAPLPTFFTTDNHNASAFNDPVSVFATYTGHELLTLIQQPSILSLMKKSGLISSLSWGFSVGNHYRSLTDGNAFTSLTFGGYDLGRIVGSSLLLPMGGDEGRELMVTLQAVSLDSGMISKRLIKQPVFAALDSSQPFTWLPIEDCQLFEEALGINWNETSKIYTFNETQLALVRSQLLKFNFQLSNGTSSGDMLNIPIDFGAFDLVEKSLKGLDEASLFPLKRAANSTQVCQSL